VQIKWTAFGEPAMIEFEWDPEKARANLRKHGVSFVEAGTVFGDPLSICVFDPDHSSDEERYITIGTSRQGRAIMIAHAERGNRIRVISARELTRAERKQYEKELQNRTK
jgi:uncharacterized protein